MYTATEVSRRLAICVEKSEKMKKRKEKTWKERAKDRKRRRTRERKGRFLHSFDLVFSPYFEFVTKFYDILINLEILLKEI